MAPQSKQQMLLYKISLHKYHIFTRQSINAVPYSKILHKNDRTHQNSAKMSVSHNKYLTRSCHRIDLSLMRLLHHSKRLMVHSGGNKGLLTSQVSTFFLQLSTFLGRLVYNHYTSTDFFIISH